MKRIIIVFALLFSFSALGQLQPARADELLEPDKAFRLSTRVIDADTLEAKWDIADGYYMYRDKFKFDLVRGRTKLLSPIFPKGKRKKDPLFGDVEIYVRSVAVRVPLKRNGRGAENITLRITGQGCNDPIGVCYQPITKKIDFALPAVAANSPFKSSSKKIDSLKALRQLLQPDGLGQEFLPPDQAFGVDVIRTDNRNLNVRFRITDGYYLYRNKIKFSLNDSKGRPLTDARVGNYQLPRGKMKADPTYGRTEVYYNSFDVPIPIQIRSGETQEVTLQIDYQGCADGGICYAPTTKQIALKLKNGSVELTDLALDDGLRPYLAGDGQAKTLSTGEYWLAILGAFGVGLLLTFTPCVLPMIPILSSIVVGQTGGKATKLRGGALAAIYVLGTAMTYAIAGAIAGATGEQLQAYFQNVWAIGIFSTILVLLALSMFGFYELRMPSFIQSHLHIHSHKLKGGTLAGVFIMGVISALIVGACVSPLLISVLAAAIQIGDPVLGALIMTSMALGMGVILIGIGYGAGFLLPKAGIWMDRVKHFFGVMLLAVAIYLLGLLPQVPVLYLWAALFIVTSIYFGALEPLPTGTSGWRYFFKGIGLLMLVWGALSLLGAFSGNRDILRPVSLDTILQIPGSRSVPSGTPTATDEYRFESVTTLTELDKRIAAASSAGKAVMLDFYATWCTDCVRMEKTTFVDPKVQQLLRDRFVAIQIDVTDPNSTISKTIKKRYRVFGPPAFLFFDKKGKARTDLSFYGYKDADAFIDILRKL